MQVFNDLITYVIDIAPPGESIQDIAKVLAQKQIPILACVGLVSVITGLYASSQGYNGYELQ
ncbi:hypothetical protein [Faecalispora anaeroviscerum]|uniref:hypothetical protein n=1 Tax=Faecalispora anaeroviscerum TaxID=2991836 RepID=UPI0024BAE0B5|nr:hypothetical protein [Faecalispora anaeroviscerum]